MIKSQDIRRFIADKLRNAEFNVISSEIQEGYPKPGSVHLCIPIINYKIRRIFGG